MPLARLPECLLQEHFCDRFHCLVAADVVLSGDGGVAVSEEFGRELQSPDLVDRGRSGAAEPVRGHVRDPGLVHHVAELPADVVGRVRRPDTGREQQRVRVGEADLLEARLDRPQGEVKPHEVV